MTEYPLISFVCAWYERENSISMSVSSMLEQDYPNFEIVVVNDGSLSSEVLEKLSAISDPRLRVVHQENQGFVFAIRRAIDLSHGEFIAIMGAGDICEPSRLRLQYDVFRSKPKLSIVGCHYTKLYTCNKNDEIFRPLAPDRGAIGHFGFSHGELMYRRKVYEEVGGYNVNFGVGQGSELWMRMLCNYEAEIVPKIIYHQIVYDDGVSKNTAKISKRNNLIQHRQYFEMAKRVSPKLSRVFVLRYNLQNTIRISLAHRAIIEFLYLVVRRRLRIPLIRRIKMRLKLRTDTHRKSIYKKKVNFTSD